MRVSGCNGGPSGRAPGLHTQIAGSDVRRRKRTGRRSSRDKATDDVLCSWYKSKGTRSISSSDWAGPYNNDTHIPRAKGSLVGAQLVVAEPDIFGTGSTWVFNYATTALLEGSGAGPAR